MTAPQIKGSIIAGALFAFISSFDEVVVSLFLSGGPTSTLPKRMFVALRDEVDPTIAAISSLLIFASLGIGLAGMVASRKRADALCARQRAAASRLGRRCNPAG